MQSLAFYGLSAVAIGASLLMVCLRNITRALFLFFIVLFAIAGLYVLAMADFVAIAQILIYVGGVLVLMLFAFMLSGRAFLQQMQSGATKFLALPAWQALFIAGTFFFLLLYMAFLIEDSEISWITIAQEHESVIKPTDQTITSIGIQLMTRYLLPFEIVSVLLMLALVGAAHLTREENSA